MIPTGGEPTYPRHLGRPGPSDLATLGAGEPPWSRSPESGGFLPDYARASARRYGRIDAGLDRSQRARREARENSATRSRESPGRSERSPKKSRRDREKQKNKRGKRSDRKSPRGSGRCRGSSRYGESARMKDPPDARRIADARSLRGSFFDHGHAEAYSPEEEIEIKQFAPSLRITSRQSR
jgi:hypothetical protein